MRLSAILVALATIVFVDATLARQHTPTWKRANDHHYRRRRVSSPSYNIDHDDGHDPNLSVGQNTNTNIHNRDLGIQGSIANGRFSFYDAGLGACGAFNSGNDFIVALNSIQFDSKDYCFKKITITVNGKTTQATITDRCLGCPYGGLDFSRGLFNFFAEEAAGIIYGDWSIEGASNPPPPSRSKVEVKVKVEASSPPSPPPPPPPPPSPPPSPPPPPPPSFPSPVKSPATSSSTASSSATSSSVVPSSSESMASSSASVSFETPSPTFKPEDHKGCVENLDLAMIHLGAMIASGVQPGQSVNSSPSLVASSTSESLLARARLD